MARPANTQPTDGELEILKLLWSAGPSELGQVCTGLRRKRPVATTTVATMLKVMLDKGLVQRNRGQRGYLWLAKVTQQATSRGLLRKLLDRAFDGSARGLVAHLLDDCQLSPQECEEIRRMLDAHSAGKPL